MQLLQLKILSKNNFFTKKLKFFKIQKQIKEKKRNSKRKQLTHEL